MLMPKRSRGLEMLKPLTLLTLTALTASCAALPNSAAICDGTAGDRRSHAAALIIDGGETSKITGANLLSKFDAGCAE